MDSWEIQPLDTFASLTTVYDSFAKLSVGSVLWTPLAPTPTEIARLEQIPLFLE